MPEETPPSRIPESSAERIEWLQEATDVLNAALKRFQQFFHLTHKQKRA